MLGQQNEVYRTRFFEDNSSVSEVGQLNCFWTTIRWHDVDILCSLGLPAHTTHRNTKMRSNAKMSHASKKITHKVAALESEHI